jgi:tetratricopeptide (TPR) repeat protein
MIQPLPPELALALAERGLCFESLDDFTAARDAARLRAETGDATACYQYALLLSAAYDWEAALPYLDRVLASAPGMGAALAERGLARAGLDQYDLAMVDLQTAINADPMNVRAYTNRATIHLWRRHWSAAIEDATRALRIAPEYAPPHRLRAIAWQAGRNATKAVCDFRAYLALMPDAPDRAQIERTIARLDGGAGSGGWLSRLFGAGPR